MADVSQLELNGTTYDICDATARDSLDQIMSAHTWGWVQSNFTWGQLAGRSDL